MDYPQDDPMFNLQHGTEAWISMGSSKNMIGSSFEEMRIVDEDTRFPQRVIMKTSDADIQNC